MPLEPLVEDSLPVAVGRYRITGLLGRGGMGVVYLATAEGTSVQVAIKTVVTVNSKTLGAIRAEVQSLKRMRHPGIVKIVDEGLSEGLPWYAMEYLEGLTLEQLNGQSWPDSRAGTGTTSDGDRTERTLVGTASGADSAALWSPIGSGPASPPSQPAAAGDLVRIIELYRRLCEPLAYVHRAGIVHRDLKPSNVFVRNGLPVLTDFGLVGRAFRWMARGPQELLGRAVGSIHYISPEQIRGEFVDARADLYSFGCMLYESLTGRPPFDAADASQVIDQHLHETPRPPSALVFGIPQRLEELVLCLLAKSPRKRLGYVDDVADVLIDLGASASSYPGSSDEPVADYFYRPQIAGRRQLVDQLENQGTAAAAGSGALVLIQGESGIGKTALVAEFARRAAANRFIVVAGQCLPSSGDSTVGAEAHARPLEPLQNMLLAIADRCRERGEAASRATFANHLDILSAIDAGIAALGWPKPPPDLQQHDPVSARRRVLNALAEAIAAFAADKPLVIVIEDLHWADEFTLAFLGSLSAAYFKRQRIMVVGTYRPKQASPALRRLAERSDVSRLALTPLDEDAIGNMVADMLAVQSPPHGSIDFLTTKAEGNPLIVMEYLRCATLEGILKRRSGSWQIPATLSFSIGTPAPAVLPQSKSALVARRLEGVDPEARAALEAAAVIARATDLDVLAQVADLPRDQLTHAVQLLRRRQLLEELDDGDVRFTHDEIRQSAYATIDPDRRKRLHRRCAGARAQRSGAMRGLPQAELAHHWAEAGLADRAARCFLEAGDLARGTFANEDALALYRAGIVQAQARSSDGSAVTSTTLAQLAEGAGDVLALAGAQSEARAMYERALDAGAGTNHLDLVRIQRKMGSCWSAEGEHRRGLTALQQAERLLDKGEASSPVPTPAWWQEWAQLQIDQIWTHYWLRDLDEMHRLSVRVGPIVEANANARQLARYFQSLAILLMHQGRYRISPETVANARRAVVASEQAASLRDIGMSRFVLGFALLFEGGLAEAEAELSGATEYAETIGDIPLQCRCATYLAIARRFRGDLEGVEHHANRTIQMATMGGMDDYLGASMANLGWIAWRRRDLETAEQHTRAALAAWGRNESRNQTKGGLYPFQGLALWVRLALAFERGRLDECPAAAQRLLDPSQQVLDEAAAASLVCLVELIAGNHEHQARETLKECVERATAQRYL